MFFSSFIVLTFFLLPFDSLSFLFFCLCVLVSVFISVSLSVMCLVFFDSVTVCTYVHCVSVDHEEVNLQKKKKKKKGHCFCKASNFCIFLLGYLFVVSDFCVFAHVCLSFFQLELFAHQFLQVETNPSFVSLLKADFFIHWYNSHCFSVVVFFFFGGEGEWREGFRLQHIKANEMLTIFYLSIECVLHSICPYRLLMDCSLIWEKLNSVRVVSFPPSLFLSLSVSVSLVSSFLSAWSITMSSLALSHLLLGACMRLFLSL